MEADATPDKGGRSAGFRPHELLEAALAACINMTARMTADRAGIPLAGVEVRVSLRRDDPQRTEFRVAVDLVGDLTDAQRSTILQTVSDSPVQRTLSKELVFAMES